jgi:hypothetical protein
MLRIVLCFVAVFLACAPAVNLDLVDSEEIWV